MTPFVSLGAYILMAGHPPVSAHVFHPASLPLDEHLSILTFPVGACAFTIPLPMYNTFVMTYRPIAIPIHLFAPTLTSHMNTVNTLPMSAHAFVVTPPPMDAHAFMVDPLLINVPLLLVNQGMLYNVSFNKLNTPFKQMHLCYLTESISYICYSTSAGFTTAEWKSLMSGNSIVYCLFSLSADLAAVLLEVLIHIVCSFVYSISQSTLNVTVSVHLNTSVTLASLMLKRNLYRRHDFCIMYLSISYGKMAQNSMQHNLYIFALYFKNLMSNCTKHQYHRHLTRCIRKSKFTINKWNNLYSDKLIPAEPKLHIPSTSTYLGGHSPKLFTSDTIFPYIDMKIYNLHTDSKFRYIDYINENSKLPEYMDTTSFVCAQLPLTVLFNNLTLSQSRKIAKLHGFSIGSKSKVIELLTCAKNHNCLNCSNYFTVLSVEKSTAQLTKNRVKKLRQKQKEKSISDQASSTDYLNSFPPKPVDKDLTYNILTSACKNMSKDNFEEAGCAVCGELKLKKNLSRLKSVKNLLHILMSPGVTRIERKTVDKSVKEYSGPVLDYSCDKICNECRVSIRNGKVPRLALANNLWIGKVPDELKTLRYIEKVLIARVRHTCSYVKVASGMRKMKANIIAFESPIPKVYKTLPPPREDLDDVLAIVFTGPTRPTLDDFNRTPFLVRRNHVAKALEWLKLNHTDYADIEISQKNLDEYMEDTPPVSIEYRSADTNKNPEGTSVFDMDNEDGVEDGDCVFTVHGLTGEALNTMTPNAIKAMALRHMNNNGKMLAVGHSSKLQSIWNNPQLYPQMFPWLFPFGLGGIGTTSLSDKEHKRHLLMYHDKRFQTDINFPFVAFCHEQMKISSTQSFLMVDQKRFNDISSRLLSLDQDVLNNLIEKLASGVHIKPETVAEKNCFQVIKDLDHIAGKMHGSTTSKKYMRNEIWSLINHLGAPFWYITLSPADIHHPICIYYADTQEEFKPQFLSYDERVRKVCQNPVAGARFFHFIVQAFIKDVLGIESKNPGLYGETAAYYGTVEQQGRLTLHLHLLLWIKGSRSPQEIRDQLLNSESDWNKKVITWLESCHTGDFLSGTHSEVLEAVTEMRKHKEYIDPTRSLPELPAVKCKTHIDQDSNCKVCNISCSWWTKFKHVTDDLLLRSNVHSCSRGNKKDGTRYKNKASGSCTDNRWGKCKARFPRSIFIQTIIEKTGAINMKKIEPWLNTFTPLLTYLFRCNTDVTCLLSGTAIKAVVLYVSDYITKTSLKTHTIFDSIRSVFHKNSEMIGGSLPNKEKSRRLMTKVVNLLSARAEMGAPMICMYLLGNPDHYTGHSFVPFYWQSFVTQAREVFINETESQTEIQKVALIKRKGRIVGLSPVYDYIYRSPELENICLYDWIKSYTRKKVRQTVKKQSLEDNKYSEEDIDQGNNSFSSLNSSIDEYTDMCINQKKNASTYYFTSDHPLYDSHATVYIQKNDNRIPNFIGATLPRCDQGDREYYCCTMLALFKPWRTGYNLKKDSSITWDDAFQTHQFSASQYQLMKNFNIRYECLDARDDYRAQLKKGITDHFINSWDNDNDSDNQEIQDFHIVHSENNEYDDSALFNEQNIGSLQTSHLKQMKLMNTILTNSGWTDPLSNISTNNTVFKPERVLNGLDWAVEIQKKKQEIHDKRNENNLFCNNSDPDIINPLDDKIKNSDLVKVVDKSFLQKKFKAGIVSNQIDECVEKFSLNTEQERAFRIIANHACAEHPEQLKMYIGGMGGTGKSQILKALSYYFSLRKEAHRFIVVAPTGTAAALLGGSTYHSMFGINDRIGNAGLAQVKARLLGVEYVFFDEVSMLSARDMYRISNQLNRVLNINELPFGGLNMVFCGDFAQLPPAIGGEKVALYSNIIGIVATDKKSQEEAIGKALWHQITTVVILRQNMRQKQQSENDNKLRTALENMRYKACTLDDLNFLRTKISSSSPNKSNICDTNFRNVSIITGKNVHKDEINRVGAIRFAAETNQTLTHFFSEDSPISSVNVKSDNKPSAKINIITPEVQEMLWSQPPSSTDQHIAGKLSLCIGLPIMIRYNYATELCITRGQEGYVYGWQAKTGKKGQQVLDTLFVKLKNPPSNVQFDGLPENVVPLSPSPKNISAKLPNDKSVNLNRTQVEILVNFAMTDFASQGKTRDFNVVDLNNLQSHQAYYTALSRSASADGTLILQGYDNKRVTGGCSGALRQEFRELELLDEITNLLYEGKLPLNVNGDTRNSLIKTFRNWKGMQYVPQVVHSSIRWSKKDPLEESQICNIKDMQHLMKEKKSFIKNSTVVNSKKRILDDSFNENEDEVVHKKVCFTDTLTNASHNNHYVTPRGLKWSNNSCAYDTIFTLLFSVWWQNKSALLSLFSVIDNIYLNRLLAGFQEFANNVKEFEIVRDELRHALHALDPHNLKYGCYTSVEAVFHALFVSSQVIYISRQKCINNHIRKIAHESSVFVSFYTQVPSIREWIHSINESNQCSICDSNIDTDNQFIQCPPMIVFHFSGQNPIIDYTFELDINNTLYKFGLSGIIYFGSDHFIGRIITSDSQVWIYDGIKSTDQMIIYDGLLLNNRLIDLNICDQKKAIAAIYILKPS